MRTTVALGAVAFAVAVLAVPGTSAPAHALATCQGETATVVGTPGGDVLGTNGRDVVVSNRAASVRTLGGDDLVCITGDRSAQIKLRAGAGDDEVHVLGRTPVFALLETGEDTYIGGPLADRVYGGYTDDGGQDYDEEFDHVETGGGDDDVVVGEGAVGNDLCRAERTLRCER